MKDVLGAVYFNHGKESGPWGTKIQHLARIARGRGFAVESLDYTGMYDAEARVRKLLESHAAEEPRLVLVGSSMGAYVATVASQTLKPEGLFLMAPAFYLEDFADQDPTPHAGLVTIVHGWKDSLVPVENSIRFARKFSAELYLVDGDHPLNGQILFLEMVFGFFLDRLVQGRKH